METSAKALRKETLNPKPQTRALGPKFKLYLLTLNPKQAQTLSHNKTFHCTSKEWMPCKVLLMIS